MTTNSNTSVNHFFIPAEGISPQDYPIIIPDAWLVLGDCIPPLNVPDLLYTSQNIETEDDTQIQITLPNRSAHFQFIAHAALQINKEITGYRDCSPGDDTTMDIQNALEFLSDLSMLFNY